MSESIAPGRYLAIFGDGETLVLIREEAQGYPPGAKWVWVTPDGRVLDLSREVVNFIPETEVLALLQSRWAESGWWFARVWNVVQDSVHATAVSKGWWGDASPETKAARNDGEAIALMHSELSEGLEALRKNLPSDKIEGFSGIEEELADVVIRIMDYAAARGLNIPGAICAKMAMNEDRPFKHGGKLF